VGGRTVKCSLDFCGVKKRKVGRDAGVGRDINLGVGGAGLGPPPAPIGWPGQRLAVTEWIQAGVNAPTAHPDQGFFSLAMVCLQGKRGGHARRGGSHRLCRALTRGALGQAGNRAANSLRLV
jgi:hypothetical protein